MPEDEDSIFAAATRSIRQHGLRSPQLADSCARLGLDVRLGPLAIRPLAPSMICAGRVLPVRIHANFEALFEALENSSEGDVLVIDGGGDPSRCCMGDLMAAEVKQAGIAGILIWGAHRDTEDLLALDLPIFSLGPFPFVSQPRGPSQPAGGQPVMIGETQATRADFVVCDCDGSVFVHREHLPAALETARLIQTTELARAAEIGRGVGLRKQLDYVAYRARHERDPDYTFQEHLRSLAARK